MLGGVGAQLDDAARRLRTARRGAGVPEHTSGTINQIALQSGVEGGDRSEDETPDQHPLHSGARARARATRGAVGRPEDLSLPDWQRDDRLGGEAAQASRRQQANRKKIYLV